MRRLAAAAGVIAAVLAMLLAGCAAATTPGPSTGATPTAALASTAATATVTIAPTPTAVGCPDGSSFEVVAAMSPDERVACLGGQSLTFDGVFGCAGCGGVETRVATPAWLAGKESDFLYSQTAAEPLGLALHFPPPLEAPEAGSILHVVGHFDDPRAGECRIAEPDPGNPDGSPMPIPAADALQYCRERFVVESFEITGTGPPPLG